MTDHLVSAVCSTLRATELIIRRLDAELANHLADLAADYAGPYTEETE